MTQHDTDTHEVQEAALERLAWLVLVACVVLVPLAVAALPFTNVRVVVSPFVFPQTVTLAVGVAAALALWAGALLKGQTRLVVTWSMIPFAAFAAWAAVATAAGYEPLQSLFGYSTSALSLTQIVIYCALAFLVVQLLDSRRRVRALTWAVVVPGALVGLIALAQQLLRTSIFGLSYEEWFIARGFATIGNPDHLGTYLVLPVLLSAVLSLCEDTQGHRVTALACLAVLLAATVGTLTRGAWIAVLFGVLVAVVILWQNLRAHLLGVWPLVVLGVCVAAIALSLARADPADLGSQFEVPAKYLRSADTSGDASGAGAGLRTINALSSDRINMWRSSLSIVSDRPLTGTGPEAFALGWYPNAITPSTTGGEIAIARDPHSLVFFVLATTGVPGFLAFAIAAVSALLYGARTSYKLGKRVPLSGTGLYYVAWFVAASALQIALLFAAVSPPILAYAFLGFAVLLRPMAAESDSEDTLMFRRILAASTALLALLLAGSVVPTALAETTLAQALRSDTADRARDGVRFAPWNIDVQRAYFGYSAQRVTGALQVRGNDVAGAADGLVDELAEAGERYPYEYYYPSVRAQVLTNAGILLGDPSYTTAAVAAADDALAIMPSSVLTRVHKALALGELGRYSEMADTLAGYWQNELISAYPGIVYAQALALSGEQQEAEALFRALVVRFPADAPTIEAARQETQELLQR